MLQSYGLSEQKNYCTGEIIKFFPINGAAKQTDVEIEIALV